MNKWFTPGVIVGLVLIGFVWLRFFHDPSVRREAQDLARADSIEAAQAARDSADAEFDKERAAFQAKLDTLRAEKTKLAEDYENTQKASVRVITRVDTVLAELPRPVREIIAAAVDTLGREAEACHALLQNCEQRAEIMQAQLSRDTLAIEIARSSTRELATQIQDLLREKRGRAGIQIGLTVGYGVTMSGGQVYAGPSITAGVQIRFFSVGG